MWHRLDILKVKRLSFPCHLHQFIIKHSNKQQYLQDVLRKDFSEQLFYVMNETNHLNKLIH